MPLSNEPARRTALVAQRAVLARTILLAIFAIGAAAWALTRHYMYHPPPFRVARPDDTRQNDSADLPAPDLLGDDAAP